MTDTVRFVFNVRKNGTDRRPSLLSFYYIDSRSLFREFHPLLWYCSFSFQRETKSGSDKDFSVVFSAHVKQHMSYFF